MKHVHCTSCFDDDVAIGHVVIFQLLSAVAFCAFTSRQNDGIWTVEICCAQFDF